MERAGPGSVASNRMTSVDWAWHLHITTEPRLTSADVHSALDPHLKSGATTRRLGWSGAEAAEGELPDVVGVGRRTAAYGGVRRRPAGPVVRTAYRPDCRRVRRTRSSRAGSRGLGRAPQVVGWHGVDGVHPSRGVTARAKRTRHVSRGVRRFAAIASHAQSDVANRSALFEASSDAVDDGSSDFRVHAYGSALRARVSSSRTAEPRLPQHSTIRP